MATFHSIEEALDDLRQGKIILVIDNPERENEGDFVCAAEFGTTANINFMATHGKGLICMPMSQDFIAKLQLPQMVQQNTDNHETAFTVSIDHVSTATGISAKERSIGIERSTRQRRGEKVSGGHFFRPWEIPLAAGRIPEGCGRKSVC